MVPTTKSGLVLLLELCTLGGVAAQVLPPVVTPYDCNAEADIWEWAWTPDWKAWCCSHEGKGCPKTTTGPPTTTTVAPTTQTATATATATHTSTATETMTSTQTVTRTATSTKTTTVAPTTKTRTTTVAPTTEAMTAIATTAHHTPVVHDKATSKASAPASKPQATAQVTTSRPQATKATTSRPETTQATTSRPEATKATTAQVTTTAKAITTREIVAPDAGCDAACIILGESATCQARISAMEKQMQHESAPCPAAHVVTMSQCSSCGTCLFKNVKCASKKGVSKSLGHHMFMYKKFSDRPVAVAGEREVQHSPPVFVASMGLVALLGMVALWRKRAQGARVPGWMAEETELLALE